MKPFRIKSLLFYTTLGIIFCFFLSCQENKPSQNRISHFDLAAFIASEIDSLSDESPVAFKQVTLNGNKEEKEIEIVDWKTELEAFNAADISKPALIGRYQIDTAWNSSAMKSITYQALDKDLKVRKLSIEYNIEKTPVKIDAHILTKNFLYTSEQYLIYIKNKGFNISGSQAIRFLEKDSFQVKARFRF